MTNPSCTPTSFPDRIKWDISFDADLLQADVQQLVSGLDRKDYVYYSAIPLRGPQGRPRLSKNGPTDFSDPRVYQWVNFPPLERSSYVKDMLQVFEADVTHVRLMRLQAGSVVQEHTDPTLDAAHRNIIRLTIPVFSNDAVTFMLNDVPVPMRPGEVWYLRLSDKHSVVNGGSEERINLSIDLIYNQWIERKLESSMSNGARGDSAGMVQL